jgi:hypothetical protein
MRCAAVAAASAFGAVAKAAQKASPIVLNMKPECALMTSRSKASWRASASLIASGCCSQSVVLPSISVNRKETVPVG